MMIKSSGVVEMLGVQLVDVARVGSRVGRTIGGVTRWVRQL
jgi:hypothetical protein